MHHNCRAMLSLASVYLLEDRIVALEITINLKEARVIIKFSRDMVSSLMT